MLWNDFARPSNTIMIEAELREKLDSSRVQIATEDFFELLNSIRNDERLLKRLLA